MREALPILALLLATGGNLPIYPDKSSIPKNKYGLTEDEAMILSTMGPKEKKKYLRELKTWKKRE